MSSEDTPVEETAPPVESNEPVENQDDAHSKQTHTEMIDNNIGGEELDYEANDSQDVTTANVNNGNNEQSENVKIVENLSNGDCEEEKKGGELEQKAIEEAQNRKEEQGNHSAEHDEQKQGESNEMAVDTKEGEQDKVKIDEAKVEELNEMEVEENKDAKSELTQQTDPEESEVVNCKEFSVTVLEGEKGDEKVAPDSVPEKTDAVSGKGDQTTNKTEGADTKERKLSGIETDPTVVCKPCNLVFESDKWCTRHKESGDHLHVVKGGVPGRGRYHCFLCWMSFQHSDGLGHHIGRSDHLKRAKRKGVKSIWMKPGASGASGIVAGDLRAQITGRGDLRDHLTDKRDQLSDKRDHLTDKRDHLHERDDRKRREVHGSTHRDRDRRHHSSTHHRSRSPVRIYLDQFYEVSSVGECDMGNCKTLRKIIKDKEGKDKARASHSKEKSKEEKKVNNVNSSNSEDKTDAKDSSVEGGNEIQEDDNQESGEKKCNGDVQDVENMETDEKQQNHEMAQGKEAAEDMTADEKDVDHQSVSNTNDEQLADVDDAQNKDEVNLKNETDEFETHEVSNKIEINNTDAMCAETVQEDTEMETDDNIVTEAQSDCRMNGKTLDENIGEVAKDVEEESSDKNAAVMDIEENTTEQLDPQ